MQSNKTDLHENNKNAVDNCSCLNKSCLSDKLQIHSLCSENLAKMDGCVVPCLTKATSSDSSKIEVRPTLTKDRLEYLFIISFCSILFNYWNMKWR